MVTYIVAAVLAIHAILVAWKLNELLKNIEYRPARVPVLAYAILHIVSCAYAALSLCL